MIMEQRLLTFEAVTIALGVTVILIFVMTGVPFSDYSDRIEKLEAREQDRQCMARLQARLDQVQGEKDAVCSELAGARALLETSRSELGNLQKERGKLIAKTDETRAELQVLQDKYQTVCEESTKLKELLSVHELAKERDDAKTRAEQAEERIRQLTLELHRSGVWP